MNFASQIVYTNQLPLPSSLGKSNLLIYDRYFETKSSSLKLTQAWIKKFPHRIGFSSGEKLKDLHQFPEKMEQILQIVSQMNSPHVQVIALGGGSLGDFAGFVASILKRGLPLIHIPTTWLSAMDSAHGGKTALNVAGFKNQIGTFYPANKIILCKSILFQQPPSRSEEAFGEALKMALLTGGSLWARFSRIKKFDSRQAWIFLPELIRGKYRIVKKDPFEKKGLRSLLNLGHTWGHVWEASLGLPHGLAVTYGIRAALELSLQEGILKWEDFQKWQNVPVMSLLPSKIELCRLASQCHQAESYLTKDKKISENNSVRYILIQNPGKCLLVDMPVKKLVKFLTSLQKELPS